MSSFRAGDIVEIPLPDGREAIGWILHVSKLFKNGFAFVVFGIKGQMRGDWSDQSRSLDVLGPLFSNIQILQHYGWKVIQHAPVSEAKLQLTRCYVGRDVFVGDERIGSIEEFGSGIKPMLAMGMPVVHREIMKTFPPTITS